MTSFARIVTLLSVAAVMAVPAGWPASGGSTPLDGRWTFVWTRAELRTACRPCAAGHYVVELRDGRLTRLIPKPVLRGARYTVHGNRASFVFPTPVPGVVAGLVYEMRWSIYRDRLTWSKVPDRPALAALVITPWTRVR